MPGWKFWEKSEPPPPSPEPEPEVIGRFNIRPRTDLIGGAPTAKDASDPRVAALRRRRESVVFDVEQARLAHQEENPWLASVATMEEARRQVEDDLAELEGSPTTAPGRPLPATPVAVATVETEPQPRVVLSVGGVTLVYEEDLDWAERGTQLARTELHLERGDIDALLPADLGDDDRAELRGVLSVSLFRLATDIRDRALSGEPLGAGTTLAELARPDDQLGGWVDTSGGSPRRRDREIRRTELRAELDRLDAERARELEEMARWRERLPIAERRLRELDAEIAAALGASPSP